MFANKYACSFKYQYRPYRVYWFYFTDMIRIMEDKYLLDVPFLNRPISFKENIVCNKINTCICRLEQFFYLFIYFLI